MDAEYLKSTVHHALADGLAATAQAQPKDPVEYLGNYLVHWVTQEEIKQQVREALGYWVHNTLQLESQPTRSSWCLHAHPPPRFFTHPLSLSPVNILLH